MKVLIEELQSRGHEITVLRPSDSWLIKPESPHYKTITISSSAEFDQKEFESFVSTVLGRGGTSLWSQLQQEYEKIEKFDQMHEKALEPVGKMFEDTKLMQSLRNAKYDVVLTDPAFGGGVFLAHRLGLPLVLNVRWTVQGDGHSAIAPSPLSYVPMPGIELTDKMTFPQ